MSTRPSFKSLGDSCADTTAPHGGPSGVRTALDLVSTNEGKIRAKANGVKFGKKYKLTKHQREEALARKQAGETLMDIAKTYNVSHMTISGL